MFLKKAIIRELGMNEAFTNSLLDGVSMDTIVAINNKIL